MRPISMLGASRTDRDSPMAASRRNALNERPRRANEDGSKCGDHQSSARTFRRHTIEDRSRLGMADVSFTLVSKRLTCTHKLSPRRVARKSQLFPLGVGTSASTEKPARTSRRAINASAMADGNRAAPARSISANMPESVRNECQSWVN